MQSILSEQPTLSEHSITWERIKIKIIHVKNYSGTSMDWINVIAPESLPITETGYLSHFTHRDNLTTFTDAPDFVSQWLDHEAKKQKWSTNQQLTLF